MLAHLLNGKLRISYWFVHTLCVSWVFLLHSEFHLRTPTPYTIFLCIIGEHINIPALELVAQRSHKQLTNIMYMLTMYIFFFVRELACVATKKRLHSGRMCGGENYRVVHKNQWQTINHVAFKSTRAICEYVCMYSWSRMHAHIIGRVERETVTPPPPLSRHSKNFCYACLSFKSTLWLHYVLHGFLGRHCLSCVHLNLQTEENKSE